MDFPIVALLSESRFVIKGFVGAMFENEEAFGSELSLTDDQGWQAHDLLVIIGWIGKDEIERVHLFFQKVEGIGLDQPDRPDIQEFKIFPDGGTMEPVALNGGNVKATQRSEFKTDDSGSRKQVENPAVLKIKPVSQNIEQAFACHVGRGAGQKIAGNNRPPSAENSVNYSHRVRFIKGEWRDGK